MRIKPWVMTGTATLIAIAAIGIVVTSSDPLDADWRLVALFWGVLVLGIWAGLTTVLLAVRMSLAQGVWVAFWWATGVLGVIIALRSGYKDPRLLGGILFVTLCLSVIAWWRLRNGRT